MKSLQVPERWDFGTVWSRSTGNLVVQNPVIKAAHGALTLRAVLAQWNFPMPPEQKWSLGLGSLEQEGRVGWEQKLPSQKLNYFFTVKTNEQTESPLQVKTGQHNPGFKSQEWHWELMETVKMISRVARNLCLHYTGGRQAGIMSS